MAHAQNVEILQLFAAAVHRVHPLQHAFPCEPIVIAIVVVSFHGAHCVAIGGNKRHGVVVVRRGRKLARWGGRHKGAAAAATAATAAATASSSSVVVDEPTVRS